MSVIENDFAQKYYRWPTYTTDSDMFLRGLWRDANITTYLVTIALHYSDWLFEEV